MSLQLHLRTASDEDKKRVRPLLRQTCDRSGQFPGDLSTGLLVDFTAAGRAAWGGLAADYTNVDPGTVAPLTPCHDDPDGLIAAQGASCAALIGTSTACSRNLHEIYSSVPNGYQMGVACPASCNSCEIVVQATFYGNHTHGRSSPPELMTARPEVVGGHCVINPADGCLRPTASSFTYPNNMDCTVSISAASNGAMISSCPHFALEARYDYFTINGHQYTGTSCPHAVRLAPGSQFTFHSDGSMTGSWQICF